MNCPVCNYEMTIVGTIGKYNTGGDLLPQVLKLENTPIFECENCKVSERGHLAYQRTFVGENWYYFNWGKWNFLTKVPFNPSKRSLP